MREALASLQHDPRLGESLHQALEGLWRIRVGDFRVVYEPSGEGVIVVAIGPRATIYVDLERAARGGQEALTLATLEEARRWVSRTRAPLERAQWRRPPV